MGNICGRKNSMQAAVPNPVNTRNEVKLEKQQIADKSPNQQTRSVETTNVESVKLVFPAEKVKDMEEQGRTATMLSKRLQSRDRKMSFRPKYEVVLTPETLQIAEDAVVSDDSDSDSDAAEEMLDAEDWLLESEAEEVIVEEDVVEEEEEEEEEDISPYCLKHKPLYDIMLQIPLFMNLSLLQQEEVLRALQPGVYQDKEAIVKQGERGDCFYMIVKGEAVVTKRGNEDNGEEIMLTYLYAGHYFGELALLYDDERTATVTAVGNDVEVMMLRRKDFLRVNQVHLSLMLKQVPLLAQLNGRDQDAVLNRLESVVFNDKEYIVRQGEVGKRFYVITHGEAIITEAIKTEEVEEDLTKLKQRELTRLYAGHAFGEMSLMVDEVRSASVQAVGPVKCVYLTKENFDACLTSTSFAKVIQENFKTISTTREKRKQQRMLPETGDKKASKLDVIDSTLSQKFARETNKLVKQRLANGNTVLNKYVIKGEIGRGQFGKVRLAQSEEDGKLYAIKVISKSFSSYMAKAKDSLDSAIRQETAIMKKLHHPNIVQLVEVIDDPSSQKYYIVQEYVDRGNLMQILVESPELEENKVRKYMHGLLRGLKYLHFQKVIHRDIKPENLLVTSDDIVKIADFGAADIFRNESEIFKDAKGTPAFMAPEMFDENAGYIGPAADVWSLGATLFMMVTGKPPWTADNEIDLVYKVQRNELVFPDPKDCALTTKPHLRNLLCRMLTKDPKRRITLDKVIKHDWVTKESSDPVIMETYGQSDKLTVSSCEKADAIRNMPQKVDASLQESLEQARTIMQDRLVKGSDSRGMDSNSGEHRNATDDQENTLKKTSSESGSEAEVDNLFSSWRYHHREKLLDGHKGLSERSKFVLANDLKFALSADRVAATEFVMNMEDNSYKQEDFGPVTLSRERSTSPKRPLTKTLSRKSDFLMLTSEVVRDDSGSLQKRKILFQAVDADFSIATRIKKRSGTDEGSSKHSLRSAASMSSKSSSLPSEVQSANDDNKNSDAAAVDFSEMNCLEGVNVEVVSDNESQDDLMGDGSSSDDSEYSDLDESVDINETFDELVRTPTNLRKTTSDIELLPIKQGAFNMTTTEGVVQVSCSAEMENLHLGLRAGKSEAKGGRPTMEDRSSCFPLLPDTIKGTWNSNQFAYFSVYDGHNGDETACMLQKFLHVKILEQNTVLNDLDAAIRSGCANMESEIINTDNSIFSAEVKKIDEQKQKLRDSVILFEDDLVSSPMRNNLSFSGSTAAIVILADSVLQPNSIGSRPMIFAANVGDSRVVLCRGDEVVDLTHDHKASHPVEKERIQQAGGFVHNGRLNGVLAISRAFGDITHKTNGQLSAIPDIFTDEITEDDEFLFIASDGLFDVLSSSQASNYIRRKLYMGSTAQEAADDLVEKSHSMLDHDNISVVVVCLNQV